ncbi:MAG: hypothetical protein P4M11_07895 [Candidatus Pacebacteria bacterium]|nr:hypothetical protein [Candidatus Paceibacterota bacterium]
MDHHCPWISNCVGFRNYKFFVLMLIYSAMSLLFVVFTYWEEVSIALTNDNVSSRTRG